MVWATLKDTGPASSKYITADILCIYDVWPVWGWKKMGVNVHKISGPH